MPMNRIFLDLGFLQIYWYSIFIFLGVLGALTVIYLEVKRQNIDLDFFLNMAFSTILIGIVGARVYYVLFNLSYYQHHILDIFKIWEGGLAIHGGILLGGLTILFYTKKYHQDTLKILDIIVVGLILGQAIGRWGNFFNGEAYGKIVSRSVLLDQGFPKWLVEGMYINGAYRQPTFFYESLWNFIGFILLQFIRKYRYLHIGQLTGSYLIWYSCGRFFIEGLRTDSLLLGSFKVAQIVSIVLMLTGVYLCFFQKQNKNKLRHLYQRKIE